MNMLTSLKAFLFAMPAGKGAKTDVAATGGAGDFAQLLNAVATPGAGEAVPPPVVTPAAGAAVAATPLDSLVGGEPHQPPAAERWTPPVSTTLAPRSLASIAAMVAHPAIMSPDAAKGDPALPVVAGPIHSEADTSQDGVPTIAPSVAPSPDIGMPSSDIAPVSQDAADAVVAPISSKDILPAAADETAQAVAATDVQQTPMKMVGSPASSHAPVSHRAGIDGMKPHSPVVPMSGDTVAMQQDVEMDAERDEDGPPAMDGGPAEVVQLVAPVVAQAAAPVVMPSQPGDPVPQDAGPQAVRMAADRPPSGLNGDIVADMSTVAEPKPVLTVADAATDSISGDRPTRAGAVSPEQVDWPQAVASSPLQTVADVAAPAADRADGRSVAPPGADLIRADVPRAASLRVDPPQVDMPGAAPRRTDPGILAESVLVEGQPIPAPVTALRADPAIPVGSPLVEGQPIPVPVPPLSAQLVSVPAPLGDIGPAIAAAVELPAAPDAPPVPQAPDLSGQAAPGVDAAPARAEAVSLLQLVRDHMSLRGPRHAEPVAALSPPSRRRDAAIDTPVTVMPVAVNDSAPPLMSSVQPVAPTFSAAAVPTVDLSASLGAQVVDMGVTGQWIDGLARDIAGLSANGAQGRFQINADQLGPIQVDIRQGDDGAAISLTVATEAAEQALRQEGDRLKLDAGLSAVRISDLKIERAPHVSEPARADTGGNQNQSQQQSGGQGQYAGHNAGQGAGQGMGQSSAQSHMQGRGQQRENIPFGGKAGNDAAVLNHTDSGDRADGAVRARYA